jgi:hypothetical protein
MLVGKVTHSSLFEKNISSIESIACKCINNDFDLEMYMPGLFRFRCKNCGRIPNQIPTLGEHTFKIIIVEF